MTQLHVLEPGPAYVQFCEQPPLLAAHKLTAMQFVPSLDEYPVRQLHALELIHAAFVPQIDAFNEHDNVQFVLPAVGVAYPFMQVQLYVVFTSIIPEQSVFVPHIDWH